MLKKDTNVSIIFKLWKNVKDENRIERVENVKNLEQYIDRVDEMINRKYEEVQKNVK